MKRIHLFALALLTFTSGCEIAIQPPPSEPFVAEISATRTQAAIETAAARNATATAPATITPVPFVINDATVIFHDDFNAVFEPGWQWQNENPATWSLTNSSGNLQIQSEPGYINLGNAKNLLLRNAPAGNFIAETSVNFAPDNGDQFAGIVLLESEQDFIQAGLGYCLPVVGCVRQGFYIDIYKNGKLTLPRQFTFYDENIMAVRMVVHEETLIVFASPNGTAWYRLLQRPMDFKAVQVGIFAGQNNDALIIPAAFGYFKISTFQSP